MMKFFRRLFVTITCSMFMLSGTSSAAFNPLGGVNCSGSAASSSVCQSKPETISGSNGILGKAVNVVAIIAGVAAVVMLLMASIMFITANGDTNQVANARRTAATVLIGVAIIATGRIIILYVLNRL